MKSPVRIGLPAGIKSLYIERYSASDTQSTAPQAHVDAPIDEKQTHVDAPSSIVSDDSVGYWNVPIHTSPNKEYGTFLRLYDNGRIESHTIRPDGDDQVILVKPEDG